MASDPKAPEPNGTVTEAPATRELTPAEAGALDRARFVSRLLDEAVRVPGTQFRFGLDPILSLLPIAGDFAAAVLSLYTVFEAYRLGAPKRTLATMLTLIAVDAVVGSVPVLGSVFDALWKANEWNVRLLERHLDQR